MPSILIIFRIFFFTQILTKNNTHLVILAAKLTLRNKAIIYKERYLKIYDLPAI